jgi:benzoate membrane transport protein
MTTLIKDCSLSAIVAGCIATMISYAGPLVIIFHAAEAAGLSHQQLSSWVWAVSMGSAVLGALLSLRYRVPVVIAWSIPGRRCWSPPCRNWAWSRPWAPTWWPTWFCC